MAFTFREMHIHNTYKKEKAPKKSPLDPAKNFRTLAQHYIP